MLGTNPLTVGMPTDEDFPFVLDCATSISQRSKIEFYARNGMDTPVGMVIGKDGNPMTDSDKILTALLEGRAALAPLVGIGEELGGYKGYGYTTVVEILSATLQGGSFLKALSGFDENGNRQPYHLGHFFIVIDPEAFMGIDVFKKTCGDTLRCLRSSEKMPGQERIYTAGEKEHLTWLDRKNIGLSIKESVQRDLIDVRNMYNLNYRFDWER